MPAGECQANGPVLEIDLSAHDVRRPLDDVRLLPCHGADSTPLAFLWLKWWSTTCGSARRADCARGLRGCRWCLLDVKRQTLRESDGRLPPDIDRRALVGPRQ